MRMRSASLSRVAGFSCFHIFNSTLSWQSKMSEQGFEYRNRFSEKDDCNMIDINHDKGSLKKTGICLAGFLWKILTAWLNLIRFQQGPSCFSSQCETFRRVGNSSIMQLKQQRPPEDNIKRTANVLTGANFLKSHKLIGNMMAYLRKGT